MGQVFRGAVKMQSAPLITRHIEMRTMRAYYVSARDAQDIIESGASLARVYMRTCVRTDTHTLHLCVHGDQTNRVTRYS